jgi:hypothetical protein
MPSVTAQDPASEPARIAEGILPLQKRRGNFVISGTMWRKFNANRPWLTFAEFLLIKDHAYNRRNTHSVFFYNFTRDAEKHHEILRDCFICPEVKRMLNNDVPYSPPTGLLEPKAEAVEEFHGDYCFMYKEEGAFVQGD